MSIEFAGTKGAQSTVVSQVRFLREYCGNQYCTVMHRKALLATDALANRLMQLKLRKSAQD